MATGREQGWWVDDRCIDCSASQTIAPEIIREREGHSVFLRQPESEAEIEAAWRALLLCPTASVHAPDGLKPPAHLFPQELAPGVYRLGYNARSSWGAHSYVVEIGGLRVMIDAPRWTTKIADWLTSRGGLSHILLTHRDDVADAQLYAKKFGARTWIHEADVEAARFARDRIEGEESDDILPGIRAIPLPGHTRGSVAYLIERTYLFTGDSLAWSFMKGTLEAFRGACWYDWNIQLRSLAKLRGETFSWVLAGHGGSIALPSERLQAELAAMLQRYGAKK